LAGAEDALAREHVIAASNIQRALSQTLEYILSR
jgi:hypothetical protein